MRPYTSASLKTLLALTRPVLVWLCHWPKSCPDAPQGLKATALSKMIMQLSWTQPPAEITDGIIGYVLHIRKYGGECLWSSDVPLNWNVSCSLLVFLELYFIIGALLFSEPESKELQEAVSKTTFQHDLTNLEPATTYSIYLKAYSPLGASERSSTVVSTTLGGGM